MKIQVAFCCNDPRNGNPLNRLAAVDFGCNGTMKISSCFWEDKYNPAFQYVPGFVVISGRKYACISYSSWVGNWCWDGAWFDLKTAARLINDLKRCGKFSLDEGHLELFSRWENGFEFSHLDLQEAFADAEE